MGESLHLVRVEGKELSSFAAKLRGRVRDQTLVEKKVRQILDRVKEGGDEALIQLTRELDGADLKGLRVSAAELAEGLDAADEDLVEALRFSLNRVAKTQGQLLKRLSYSYVSEGFVVRTSPRAIESVGCYVPGGRAAYASSVLMTAGVAKLAGVKRVVVCSPPRKDGTLSPAILAACSISGVDEVYRIGGAQSIAAMAYGTESVRPVQKIVGPGGLYASVAKKLVSDRVPIDFFAGPTELVVVGDDSSDPRSAAWDLVGQAEHGEETLCGVVTWDERFATKVRAEAARISKSVERGEFVRGALSRGFVALCAGREEAAGLVNAIAPEHLEVLVEKPREFAEKIENAGLILLGEFAPCAASDYCIGTDHVIPTEGYARQRTGLSALDFVKINWVVEGTKDGLRGVLPSLKTLANAEGLPNHYRSAESRFKR